MLDSKNHQRVFRILQPNSVSKNHCEVFRILQPNSVSKNQQRVFRTPQPKDKKAQIGETMTWVVATIVIIVILIISIYAASLLAQKNKIIRYKEYERESDIVMEKSIFAYFLSGDNSIYNELVQQEFYADFDDKIDEINHVLK